MCCVTSASRNSVPQCLPLISFLWAHSPWKIATVTTTKTFHMSSNKVVKFFYRPSRSLALLQLVLSLVLSLWSGWRRVIKIDPFFFVRIVQPNHVVNKWQPGSLSCSGGNLLQSQLPSECDYLLRILKFMLTLKQSGETATIIQTFICKHNCTINRLELNVVLEEKLHVQLTHSPMTRHGICPKIYTAGF